MRDKLTPKQSMFCREYLVDLNGKHAAIRAGYSKKTAHSIATENLTKPEIRREIQALMNKRSERVDLNSDDILNEIKKLGFSDVRKIFTSEGHLKNIHELPDDIAAAVQSVEVVTRSKGSKEVEYVHKMRLVDKKGALELLGKHLKLFTDRVEHSGKLDVSGVSAEQLDSQINERLEQLGMK